MPLLGVHGRQAAATVRTVVDVLGRELLQRATAQAQVLDGPGQPAGVRGERQHLSDDLELLAGLAVHVDAAGLDLADDLAVVAGPQAVSLTVAHAAGTISTAHADPDLSRLPAPRDRQQRLQRVAGPGAGQAGPRGPPAVPGPRRGPAGLGLGRAETRKGQGLHPGYRPRTPRLCRRRVRGLRGDHL